MLKPYYQNELVTLYNGDCLDIMPELKEKFDCCITDLPYGTVACAWDCVVPFDPMWKNLENLVKSKGAIALFGIEPFSSKLRLSNIKMWKYDWIWNKKSFANFLNVKFQPGKVHEIISVFSESASSYSKNGNMIYNPQLETGKPYRQKSGKQKTENNNSSVRSKISQVITKNNGIRYPISILEFSKEKSSFHPTQKPVELIEYLIKTYTNENELVLDFTAGSGTTGVACMNTNRKCVLIEKEEKYCDIIVERLKQSEKEKSERLF